MAEPQTRPTGRSVDQFLDWITDDTIRRDCRTVAEIMLEATKIEPRMWGPGIVGYGEHRYTNGSGKTSETFLTGFAPRKGNVTIYLMDGFEHYAELLLKLGKHTKGKSCLHIKNMDDVHLPTLKRMVRESVRRAVKSSG